MQIQRLFTYPIKSLLPVEIDEAVIDGGGLRFDRQFVLIQDQQGEANGQDQQEDPAVRSHLTIKTTSELCLFRQFVNTDWTVLTVSHPHTSDADSLRLPLSPSEDTLHSKQVFSVAIFGTKAQGWDMGEQAQEFFSKHMKQPVRLLYIGPGGQRDIPAPSLVPKVQTSLSWLRGEMIHPQKIRFNDAAPLLITTSASEEDARARLPSGFQQEDIIVRFRPNIHITSDRDDRPYSEDDWKRAKISAVSGSV